VLSGAINATENRACCNERLAKMSCEVDVRFIALFNGFHGAQSPFVDEKL
jgi:hypothetical protein